MVLFYSCRHCRPNKFTLALGIGYPTVWAAEKRNIAISISIYHILSSSTIVSWTWGKLKYVDSLEILFPTQLDRPAGVSPYLLKPTNISYLNRQTYPTR